MDHGLSALTIGYQAQEGSPSVRGAPLKVRQDYKGAPRRKVLPYVPLKNTGLEVRQ